MGGGLLMTENLDDNYWDWEWSPWPQMLICVEGREVGEFEV